MQLATSLCTFVHVCASMYLKCVPAECWRHVSNYVNGFPCPAPAPVWGNWGIIAKANILDQHTDTCTHSYPHSHIVHQAVAHSLGPCAVCRLPIGPQRPRVAPQQHMPHSRIIVIRSTWAQRAEDWRTTVWGVGVEECARRDTTSV